MNLNKLNKGILVFADGGGTLKADAAFKGQLLIVKIMGR